MENEALKVLLIDDDVSFCLAMSKALRRRGLNVQSIHTGEEAIEHINQARFPSVAILDLRLPKMNGLEVLYNTRDRVIPVVMLTGHGGVPEAVEAMRAGAYTFLTKPVDAETLFPLIHQACGSHRETQWKELIGNSDVLCNLRTLTRRLALSQETVLITGESGTGKELVARALHAESTFKDSPFYTLNTACIPSSQLDKELFGFVREDGSEQEGLLSKVMDGTLFLDEISELQLELQAKLLQVLDERSFRLINGSLAKPFNGRLIAASHIDLSAAVQRGTFREDLYYRLQVIPLYLPPLRDRREDVLPILESWLEQLTGKTFIISQDACNAIETHAWPGNAREVINLARRLAIFANQSEEVSGELVRRMLKSNPFDSQVTSTVHPPSRSMSIAHMIGEESSLEELERAHILSLLDRYRNISQVSKILKISRRTLQRRLKSWGLTIDSDG